MPIRKVVVVVAWGNGTLVWLVEEVVREVKIGW